MQDDLTDAVQWAVHQGIADPTRVAIYGGSYGGAHPSSYIAHISRHVTHGWADSPAPSAVCTSHDIRAFCVSSRDGRIGLTHEQEEGVCVTVLHGEQHDALCTAAAMRQVYCGQVCCGKCDVASWQSAQQVLRHHVISFMGLPQSMRQVFGPLSEQRAMLQTVAFLFDEQCTVASASTRIDHDVRACRGVCLPGRGVLHARSICMVCTTPSAFDLTQQLMLMTHTVCLRLHG